jgi:hypothetical protein
MEVPTTALVVSLPFQSMDFESRLAIATEAAPLLLSMRLGTYVGLTRVPII